MRRWASPHNTGGARTFKQLGCYPYIARTVPAAATVEIHSTIIGQADSSFGISEFAAVEDNGGSVVSSGDGNLIRRALSFNGTIVSMDDPLLETLAPNGGPTWTHALGENSPALDQGLNPLNLTMDQRGHAFGRVANTVPDIGAFERQSIGGPLLPGDYNQNLVVDAADYVLWRKTFGAEATAFAGADGDGDGRIDNDDYGVWRANFGNTGPSAAVADLAVAALAVEELAIEAASPLPDFSSGITDMAPISVSLPTDTLKGETRRLAPARMLRSVRPLPRDRFEMILISVLDTAQPPSRNPADAPLGRCSSDGKIGCHNTNFDVVVGVTEQVWSDWPAAF